MPQVDYPAKTLYKGDVAKRYDEERFSSLMGKLYGFFEKLSISRALRTIPRSSTVLDIPCGTGRIARHVEKLGYPVIGADISRDMICLARQRAVNCVVDDIENIKFKDDYFDVVTCVRMMGHLPDKAKALKEMRRVAKHLVVTFYFKPKPNWHSVTREELETQLIGCKLKVLATYHVFPGWSDGITYLLERDDNT